MLYTSKQYAQMAHEANQTGKVLAVENGQLVLKEPEYPTPSLENQITALQSVYATKLRATLDALNVAVALNDTDALADKRAEYAALVTEQKTAVDALILGGAV